MYIISSADLLIMAGCAMLSLETLNKSNKRKFIAIGTQSEKQFLKTQGLYFVWLN